MWRLIAIGLGLLGIYKWKELKQGLTGLFDPDHRPDAEPARDDLKEIPGIGPALEKTLNGLGIVSFRQIALLGDADVERIASHFKAFKGRIRRDDWIGKARQLHYEKHGERL